MTNELKEPLVVSTNGSIDEQEKEKENYLNESLKHMRTTDFAKAGWFSELTLAWLNPVLEVGLQKPLRKDNVPLLMREHRTTRLHADFNSNWPTQYEENALWRTLVKTYGRQFVLTTSLPAFAKVLVMYVGPLLIQSFSSVAAGQEAFPYEGYVLVLALFCARTVEVCSSHVYFFNCSRLGIQARTAIISSVYRKGLRISSAARQSHGAGQIVNYMSTDAQNICDSVRQLNNVWLVPVQVSVAIVILFFVAGIPALAGTLFMICSAAVSSIISDQLQKFLGKIMVGRDSRMRATVEALANMKIIKLQAWDAKFYDLVAKARKFEFDALTRMLMLQAIVQTSMWVTPLLSTVVIFATAYFMGRNLSASAAFTTIATIKVVQEPLRLLPQGIVMISQALISLNRLGRYLWSEDLDETAVLLLPTGALDSAISVKEGTFSWTNEPEDPPTLVDIDLQVTPGSFVAIVGRVGTGKSSLLAALLGEMRQVDGSVKVCGSKAYVSQQAWIQNGTIQENILFGKPMDSDRYESVLDCCALRADLAQFDGGDQTEIGERGLNLSGGQKQRIQLARAVYQNRDVYLLDDIFSAVDAHTASDLFRDCIVGALGQKTVMLVTHQIDFLRGADLIVVMRDGKIVQSGHYDDLLTGGTYFELLVGAINKASMQEPEEQDDSFSGLDRQVSDGFSLGSGDFSNFVEDTKISSPRMSLATKVDIGDKDRFGRKSESSGQLVKEEEREIGKVRPKVYWMYFTKVYRGVLFFIVLVIQGLWQGFQIGSDYWVARGAPSDKRDTSAMSSFVMVYSTLVLCCAATFFLRMFLITLISLETSQSYYLGMLRTLFRAPMSFFDTTPTGRILSRMCLDQATVDIFVTMWLGSVLAYMFQLVGVLFVTLGIVWEIVILVVPLGYFYYRYQNYYFATARELTRIDALTKAPMINHFSETVTGVVTIRGFQEQDRFIQTNVDRVDSNARMEFHNQAASEWVGLRMEMIGIWILCVSSFLLVALPANWVDEELVGLCLAYGLNLNLSLFASTYMYCQLETKMISVERIEQYSHLPSEAELSIEKTRPRSTWPELGGIRLQNLKLRYRPNTPLVLKGITLKIQGGQKVGVVGRTGSGKSTLILALFRLVEAAEGRILIDHVDISTLGLNDLRSRLGIIPQDPTLFDGTIRNNLDPLGEHSDTELWEVLEKCQLANIVRQEPERLDALVLENGENWSVGQRQLFCLGRVLLKRSQILVLDEATASVDAETDAVMQVAIRQDFKSSTVISVAHRIPTVMDCDKVLVLDAGKVKEYDSPTALVNNPRSLFSALVKEYSNRSSSREDF